MDENQQDTITRLKFLGKVNKGEKINVKELTLQSEGYVTALSRSVWCVDNRNNTISFIQNTIQAAFNLIQLLSKNNGISDQELAKTIIRDIGLAKIGINNLKTTYSEDTFFCCSVDTYVTTVNARLLDLKGKLPALFVEDEETETGEKSFKTD
ncbi:MAG: hypothetical protein ACXABD_08090 [Candidatus Thorarchaeota archaeon]|jgi:hypothetical protein